MTDATTEELANVPTLATWTDCKQISDEEWSGMVNGTELRVRGTMPAAGEMLVTKQKGDRMIVAGKVILEKPKGSSDGNDPA